MKALRALPELDQVEVTPVGFDRAPRHIYRSMARALNGFDVAHIQYSPAFFGGLDPRTEGWLALLDELRAPALVTVHELDLSAAPLGPLRGPAARWYRRRFFRRAMLHPAIRRRLVHSISLAGSLQSLGAPASGVAYMPLPVETAAPVSSGNRFRLRHGLREKRILLIPGFVVERKGYEVALRALAELPDEWVLVAAGGDHPADRTGTSARFLRLARELLLEKRFQVTGFLTPEELEEATAAADLVLAPYIAMSASAALAYALARGRAVIASDLPENRQVDAVRLFPAGDHQALAREIAALAAAPDAIRQLQQAARDYAARHSYPAAAAAIAQIYRTLAPES